MKGGDRPRSGPELLWSSAEASEDAWGLKRFAILADLSETEREAVAEELEEAVLERGARVASEGEEGGSLWLLLEGRVRVASERHAVEAELGPGEALGALALVGGPRRATIETLSRCRLLRLGRDGLQRLAANDPPVAVRLLESIAREAARRADAALAARLRADSQGAYAAGWGVDRGASDD